MELLEATKQGNLEALKKLLSSYNRDFMEDDDIINTSKDGLTCLHLATLSGHIEIVKYLVSQQACCNVVNEEGWTPLQLAAFHGNQHAVEALLNHPNIQINKQTPLKATALHLAVSANHAGIVRQLLDAGACATLEDNQGKVPIELTENIEILEMIPVYIGRDFLDRYHAIPEAYGAQLFYRNSFFLNDRYVYLNICLQTGCLSRYNSEIEYRTGKPPSRLMKISEIQEVKAEPRGYFDKKNYFLFSVMTWSIKRTYYTTNESNTLDWIERIKYAIEYIQQSTVSERGPASVIKRDSIASTLFSIGFESDVVENDYVETSSCIEQEIVSLSSFTIVKELGSGSFGKVYKAVKNNTGEILAIKALSKRFLEKKRQLKYAINEARVMKQLDHPNIVKLKFCFQTKRFLYLALELCQNGDLGMHLQQWKKFDEDRARFYLAQTMLALEYLHNRDIVYRDLKPDNLLLDATGNIKLTDFGLVKDKISNMQGIAASFCGSPAYLPPEMIRDQISSKAGDIYSLGVVLYEMLAGEVPFYTKDISVLFNSVLKEKLTFPLHFSKQAKDFISKAMQKDPNKRGCIQTMLGHPFMRPIDWEMLERGNIVPPILGPGWSQMTFDECQIESFEVEEAMNVDIDEQDERFMVKEFM